MNGLGVFVQNILLLRKQDQKSLETTVLDKPVTVKLLDVPAPRQTFPTSRALSSLHRHTHPKGPSKPFIQGTFPEDLILKMLPSYALTCPFSFVTELVIS